MLCSDGIIYGVQYYWQVCKLRIVPVVFCGILFICEHQIVRLICLLKRFQFAEEDVAQMLDCY